MKEIKYRAWDFKNRVMRKIEGQKWTVNINEDIYLMQYTGLKDRLGVEIYDNDIVEYYKDLMIVQLSGYKYKNHYPYEKPEKQIYILYGWTISNWKSEKDFEISPLLELKLMNYEIAMEEFEVVGNVFEGKFGKGKK